MMRPGLPSIMGLQRRPPGRSIGPMPAMKPAVARPPINPMGGLRPGMKMAAEGDTASPDGGDKLSVDLVHKSGPEDNCGNCQYYMADSQECSKVEGSWEPEERCILFTAGGGGSEEGTESSGGDEEMGSESGTMDSQVP
jgi:hypothetical protein